MENARRVSRDRLVILALAGLALLAFALRVARLGAQDLWGDEAFMAWLAQRPLSSILRDLAQGEPHPPLYPLLLWAWVKFAGHGEFALRYISVLFGVAMVPLVAVVGRALQGRRLALVAALLVTINPFMIWYSQETRMYIMVATLAAGSAAALLAGLAGRRWAWLGFAVSATLMIYTHYYGLLVLAAFGLIILACMVSNRLPRGPWVSALAIIAALYLPWVYYASHIFMSYYGVAPGRVDLGGIFSGFWLHSTLGLAADQKDDVRWLPLFLLLALLGTIASAWKGGAKRGRRQSIGAPSLLMIWLLVPLVGGLLISTVRPMYAERYLIVSTLPLLLVVAWGLVLVARWWPAHLCVLLLVMVATFTPLRNQYVDHRFVKSEYSQHTAEVQGLAQPNDGIILDAPSQGFLLNYYYEGQLPHYPLPRDVPLDEAATSAELKDLAARHSGLWVFLYATHDYDPGDFVEKWLSTNSFRAWHTWTINGRLVYYANYRPDELTEQARSAQFGDQLELRSYATNVQPYSAGQVIPLLFNWRALTQPAQDLKVSLRLRDEAGFLWGQTDVEPVSGFRPTHTWPKGEEVADKVGLLILPGTPPGRYSIELRVYPPGGQPLPVTGTANEAAGSVLTLGEVLVARPSQTVTGIGIPAYRQIGAHFGDQVALEGESGMGEVTAGQAAYLTTLWRALKQPLADYEAELRLVDKNGRVGATVTTRPVNGEYGTAGWAANDVVRWQYNMRVPPKTQAGEYRLMLSLRPPGGAPLSLSIDGAGKSLAAGDAVEIQRIVVKPRPKQMASSKPQVEVQAVIGNKIRLLGYSVGPQAIAPSGKLALTLYWEPLAESEVAFTVFTHLMDGSQRIWAQQDAQPCGGGCPTTAWVPGDLIEDHYELSIKPDTPPGEYQIELGMYDAAKGTRLGVVSRDGQRLGDRVLLPKVAVRQGQ